MTDPNIWNQLLIWPILNVLVALYQFFAWLGLPGPLGFAVIGMTILIRLILHPLMIAQLRSAKKMQAVKPHLDALGEKHKGDKQALQQAQMALYKEHGVNPAAGCLPLLVQMPVLIALYNVFYSVLNNGNLAQIVADINKIVYFPALKLMTLDLTFFGINLGIKPSQWQTVGWWLLAIPVITAGLQYWQTKLMMAPKVNTTNPTNKPIRTNTTNKKTDDKKEEQKTDMAADMQKQMAIITPIMFGWFAFQFPLGLALYWNVFGLFGIMQQLAVNKEA